MPFLRYHRGGLAVLAGAAALSLGLLAGPALPSAQAARPAASAQHAGPSTATSVAPLILTRRSQAAADAAAASGPQPFSPQQIRKAYALPARGASHQTVAIISAFDDPTVQSDLAVYDKDFGLPACTEGNGCLKVLNQEGKPSPLPVADPTSDGQWRTESAIGTELVHALCESCKIMLIEASFSDSNDFSPAALAAAQAGATVLVTTFTPDEPDNEADYAADYTTKHAVTVSATGDGSGDTGYSGELNFPSALPGVLAAGGTTLTLGHGGAYGSETAWDRTVSGCSSFEKAPSYQQRIMKASGCAGLRAGADVSAEADPGTIIYASGIQGTAGGALYQAEGTSVSAPILGAVIGLAGSDGSGEAKMLYARQLSDPKAFHDVTKGSNAEECTGAICNAGPGWDGPTGLGTPDGLEAFLPGGPVVSAKSPKLTISASSGKLRLGRDWKGSFTLANGNAFRVFGTATLRATLRVSGRNRSYTFATAAADRTSLQSAKLTLTIRSGQRALIRAHRKLEAWLFVKAHGATGKSVTVKQRVTIVAP